MTPELLAACTGARIDRARTHAPHLTSAMSEYAIDTPARQAAFLAQVAHETAALRWMAELWGPTPAQNGYEGRADLGNDQAGDGHRFRGRGDIMITGRYNYGVYGPPLGADLITYPDLACEPGMAARIAGLYWARHHLNDLADAGNYVAITKKVNGGQNGLADRIGRWTVAKSALGLSA